MERGRLVTSSFQNTALLLYDRHSTVKILMNSSSSSICYERRAAKPDIRRLYLRGCRLENLRHSIGMLGNAATATTGWTFSVPLIRMLMERNSWTKKTACICGRSSRVQ
jgi:hypothetical protein